MSTQIHNQKPSELRAIQVENIVRAATDAIERRLAHGGPESLVGVGIIASIAITKLKKQKLTVKWNEVSRQVEEILLGFYSAELWNKEENPTLSKRLYKVRRP